MISLVSSTTQQMQQRPEQVQSRADGLRSQLDRIEQQVRFEQQTSGYPQQSQQSSQVSQQRSEQVAELIQLRERTQAFAQEVRDKADRIVQHLSTETSSPQMSSFGSSPNSQTWVAPLIQVIREQLELTQQVLQQTQASSKQS